MKKDIKIFLCHIFDSIESIEKFTKGFTFDDFEKDEKTIFAVIRALEIIGEAVNKLPVSVKNKYKEIPWKKVAGMRNKLIHEYFGVDIKIVWKTIKKDIPDLKNKILEILKELKVNKLI